jgi:hypothetical protein
MLTAWDQLGQTTTMRQIPQTTEFVALLVKSDLGQFFPQSILMFGQILSGRFSHPRQSLSLAPRCVEISQ